jgi:hypothetical protein
MAAPIRVEVDCSMSGCVIRGMEVKDGDVVMCRHLRCPFKPNPWFEIVREFVGAVVWLVARPTRKPDHPDKNSDQLRLI